MKILWNLKTHLMPLRSSFLCDFSHHPFAHNVQTKRCIILRKERTNRSLLLLPFVPFVPVFSLDSRSCCVRDGTEEERKKEKKSYKYKIMKNYTKLFACFMIHISIFSYSFARLNIRFLVRSHARFDRWNGKLLKWTGEKKKENTKSIRGLYARVPQINLVQSFFSFFSPPPSILL